MTLNSNSKAMLFRLFCATLCLLSLGFWIETKTFDTIIFTTTIMSGIIFFIDTISYGLSSGDKKYTNTAMGTITWCLFNEVDKKKDKKINLDKREIPTEDFHSSRFRN